MTAIAADSERIHATTARRTALHLKSSSQSCHFLIIFPTAVSSLPVFDLLDTSSRPCYPLHNAANEFNALMKVYHGRRTDYGCAVDVEEEGECISLHPRTDLRRHSSEFDWGFSGSGPSQLALALAADVLGDDDRAQAVYHLLRFRLVGGLPHEEWILSERQIRSAIQSIEQERGSHSR